MDGNTARGDRLRFYRESPEKIGHRMRMASLDARASGMGMKYWA